MSNKIDWSKAPEDKIADAISRIASLCIYQSDGNLIWGEGVRKKDRSGKLAGSVSSSDGYRYAKSLGVAVGVHRVIFFMHHGYCPPEVDHINRVRSDNRIENLRDPGSHTNNMGNQSHQNGRSSSFKGVCWDKNRSKWAAMIKHEGKTRYLGRFEAEAAAALAYNVAALEKFGEFAHINTLEANDNSAGYRKQPAQ